MRKTPEHGLTQAEDGTGSAAAARAERPNVPQLNLPPLPQPTARRPLAPRVRVRVRSGCASAAPPRAVTSRVAAIGGWWALRRVRSGELLNARVPAFRRFLFFLFLLASDQRSVTTSAGRTAGLGAMVRRTKPEVERYVASVQAAGSSPREVS